MRFLPREFERLSRPAVVGSYGAIRYRSAIAQLIDNLVGRNEVITSDFLSNKPERLKCPCLVCRSRVYANRSLGEGHTKQIKREFDPGSESTLAARLTHASRARKGSNP
jgi:hypothetical protein